MPNRTKTHGPFEKQGDRADKIREAMELHLCKHLRGHRRTAMNMIAEKLSRIIEGDGQFKDHWLDIAGYCECVLKEIRGKGGRK